MKRFRYYLLIIPFVSFAQLNQTDAKGKKQGAWQKNYPGTSVLMYKGQFKDDEPIGTFVYFFESGEKKAELQHGFPGGKTSVFLFFPNGQLLSDGFYDHEKKDSLWYNYSEAGELISAENYKNDRFEGKRMVYYPEGQLLEGKLQTRVLEYYSAGLRNGAYKEYFYNGNLKLTGTYNAGQRVGEWCEYYPTGQVMAKVNYQRDLLHGWTTIYDRNGDMQKRTMYRDGYALTDKELKAFLERCKAQHLDPNH
ncbi:MAG: hypothetical protein RLZZ301_222 [Bacteroidota bacterium]|jgi:antitoxin component YwqK of YwqJK toxin-antitoxin module